MSTTDSPRKVVRSAQMFFELIRKLDGPTADKLFEAIGDGASIGIGPRRGGAVQVRFAFERLLAQHVRSGTLRFDHGRFYLGPTAERVITMPLPPE